MKKKCNFTQMNLSSTAYCPKTVYSSKTETVKNGANYTYFGARYYDSDLSNWLSVDPMSDSRPNLSPYNYCQWNPVGRIDPDGAWDDDYRIFSDGRIEVTKTNDNFDRFYLMSSSGFKGKVKPMEMFIGQFDKNENGLIELPESFSFSNPNLGAKFKFSYTGSNGEGYVSGSAFAGLIGAMAESNYTDISLNHWSNADGSSPAPSRSHKGGKTGDLRPLRRDKSGNPVLTTDSQFDKNRNANLVNDLNKFGWTSIFSERNSSTGYITPGTTHYSGYTDKNGNWVPVRHNNHFHIQKFNPNLIFK